MPSKIFLETYPLYKGYNSGIKYNSKYRYDVPQEEEIKKPAIHMFCDVCESDQTFNMINEFQTRGGGIIIDAIKDARYLCSACREGERVFLIRFTYKKTGEDEETMYYEKVGQFPAWSIAMDSTLEKSLGKNAPYYKKGLVCESQSYGIGAYAYFRRITEVIIDNLLVSIEDLIEDSEREKYSAALALTKKTRIAQEKIDLVKDLLPKSLRPDNMNPLDALHDILSEGLHDEDDETCLEYADAVKKALVFLVNQISRRSEDSKVFTEGMRKILEKKSLKSR